MASSPAFSRASDQLDRDAFEFTPEHRQVLMLDALRHHPKRVRNHTREASSRAYVRQQLRAAIATRLERGDTLDIIDRQLIAPSGLPEEQQSALWLYAWSHPKRTSTATPPPRLTLWAALRNALLTLIGIYHY
jgi:hypothetical protein